MLLADPIKDSEFDWQLTACGVRRDKAAFSSGCKSHPAIAPAGSNRSNCGGNEMVEASGEKRTQQGKPDSVVGYDDQLDAREG